MEDQLLLALMCLSLGRMEQKLACVAQVNHPFHGIWLAELERCLVPPFGRAGEMFSHQCHVPQDILHCG